MWRREVQVDDQALGLAGAQPPGTRSPVRIGGGARRLSRDDLYT